VQRTERNYSTTNGVNAYALASEVVCCFVISSGGGDKFLFKEKRMFKFIRKLIGSLTNRKQFPMLATIYYTHQGEERESLAIIRNYAHMYEVCTNERVIAVQDETLPFLNYDAYEPEDVILDIEENRALDLIASE